ncbi:hypothetical protein [Gilvibacter sp.]|uniref:hypothetical protein n=1 Tax=Gilvibacter sp. TaxID=2729997 RepID=UPI0025C6F500|nr:hypothetical protein [Gilvibacter sp.]NQX77850.1 hypothetical protein [Gilvibacter sp.]
MKKLLLLIVGGLLFVQCSDDDKAIDLVFEGVTNGSFLRTVDFVQADFNINDPESRFNAVLEQQDVEEGDLLREIEVYAQYIDRDSDNGNVPDTEVLFDVIKKEDIETGPVGLPRFNLDYSLNEVLTALSVPLSASSCGDQIVLRLLIRLEDERTFTVGSGASCIIAFETFFSSPYRYAIPLVEPIASELFTGTYRYSSVVDGPFGPTFGPPHLVQITTGANQNVREIRFPGPPESPTNGRPRVFYFTVGCNESFFWENQLRKLNANCSERADDILLGPDSENASLDPLEDSVFELWLVEGYLGFDGSTGVGTVPSRIRLDKQ